MNFYKAYFCSGNEFCKYIVHIHNEYTSGNGRFNSEIIPISLVQSVKIGIVEKCMTLCISQRLC